MSLTPIKFYCDSFEEMMGGVWVPVGGLGARNERLGVGTWMDLVGGRSGAACLGSSEVFELVLYFLNPCMNFLEWSLGCHLLFGFDRFVSSVF